MSSTTRPTPLNKPPARTTLPMTVRLFVPGPAANTIVPPSVSVPLVAAAADMAGAAEIASAVPAASSAPFTSRFMLPPCSLNLLTCPSHGGRL